MNTKWKKYIDGLVSAKEYVAQRSSERVDSNDVFIVPFPTLAIYDSIRDVWLAQVKAWVYVPFQNKNWKSYFDSLTQRLKKKPDEKKQDEITWKNDNDSDKKTAVARFVKKWNDEEDEEEDDEMCRIAMEDLAEPIKEPVRLGLFFVSNPVKFGAKSIINGVEHILKPSDEYGFIEQDLCLSEKEIFDLATPISAGSRDRKFSYEIQSHETKNDRPPQSFSCTIYVLASHGISVISDIDDTIKVSNVVSRRALLRHTFCHSFQPVHGMSELYRKWSEQHCQFHYVSASPWQLYPALSCFLEKYQYPLGTVNLRQFAWKLKLLKAPDTFKVETISQMICSYPFRKYIFVGDSGELDPESYAQLYQIFPHHIIHIFIRDVCATGECLSTCKERYEKVFADVPVHRWTIFKDTRQIETNIQKLSIE